MEKKQLKIYFTSDVHGYLYPTTYGDKLEKNMGLFKCASQFIKDGNTLVMDGGDMLQGSAFAYYCEKQLKSAAPIAKAMNAAGYDYITLGNHDFNYGTEYLSEYLNALDAVCVCQNVSDKAGNASYPYVIREMENGLKVGIIGIVTDYVNVWEKKENIANVTISDPYQAAKTALEQLQGKVDVTVGIYHGGFERDIHDGRVLSHTTENVAYKIAEELSFDVLLTGHQHIPMEGSKLNGTHIVQTPEKAAQFIELKLNYDGTEAMVDSRLCAAYGTVPREISEELMPIEQGVQAWLDDTVGVFDEPLAADSKLAMAVNGSSIADFVNQVQLYYSKAQLSVTSLANDINGFTKEVTIRDIIATYPYPNTLVVFEMTGVQLRSAMERTAEYFTLDGDGELQISEAFLKPKVEHYNYDFYAGIDYTMDITYPTGERVVQLSYAGKEVNDEDTFTVCVNNYRASGAGGYDIYQDCKVIDEISIETVDMIISYFEKHKFVSVKKNGWFKVIK